MQRLEVSGAVRPIYGSLGVKRLNDAPTRTYSELIFHAVCRLPGYCVNQSVQPALRSAPFFGFYAA